MRTAYQIAGNKSLAAFYQIRTIQEIINSRFYLQKNKDLEQHWDILHDLLCDILGIDDIDYHRGIFYEVVLSYKESYLTGNEKEYEAYCNLLEKNKRQEYVFGVYQIHIGGIVEIARTDIMAAGRYSDNLLKLLEIGYGTESWQYAKMKIHILREFYYLCKREEFLFTFKVEYDYFRGHEKHYPEILDNCLFHCTRIAGENETGDYDLWMERFKKYADEKKDSSSFYALKSQIAWIKAKRLEKQKKDIEALRLLQEAIAKYVTKDKGGFNLIYPNIYLVAAYLCFKMQDYTQMVYYAQRGMVICEENNHKDSELYYQLYNYIGLMYITEQSWIEAEKLYSNGLIEIKEKFGKENETYVIYIVNMSCVAQAQGKDAGSYTKELESIKDENVLKKHKYGLNNELNQVILSGQEIGAIRATYRRCIGRLDVKGDEQERNRLKTMYLAAKIYARRFDTETRLLLAELSENYKDMFTGEQAILYWNSRVMWEWKKENIQVAMDISEKLMPEILKDRIGRFDSFVFTHIQLCVLNGQSNKAKEYIFFMFNRFANRISETGFGYISNTLKCIRTLLSIYIFLLKKEKGQLLPDDTESEILLEKVIYCKTIDREIKGLIGKCKEDEIEDFYGFKQAHRKLAALKTRYKVLEPDPEEYERKRTQCLLELAKYEPGVRRGIPFENVEKEISLKMIHIPSNTVCIDFFAYYELTPDVPIFENEIFGYLAFVLTEETGQVKIKDIIDIPLNERSVNAITSLIGMVENPGEENKKIGHLEKEIEHLNQIFARPMLKYYEGKETVYLGLDFLLQMLPVDLVFHGKNGEPLYTILVDSVRYVEEDTQIDISRADALVIGAPKLRLHGRQQDAVLNCAEMECKCIAKMFHTKPYIGTDAAQAVLWLKREKTLVHISTHGTLISEKGNLPIGEELFADSYLKFAGYEDWEEGLRDKNYGNGIISGDDFLFMDFSKTSLIVLSACMSGLGYANSLGAIQGMRWALSAAGAENSITTLWNICDDASAVLILLFYKKLKSMPVGKALYEAKKHLRQITVEELKRNDELAQIIKGTNYSKREDDYRPFTHWHNWAGFVCYHR